jgi:hypothetical protein
MLEILFLVRFCRHLSKLARAKGRSGGWGGLGAGLWLGGEIMGFIVGTAADAGAGAYIVALLFAAMGATAAYFVVKSLKDERAPFEMPLPMTSTGPMTAPAAPPDLSNPYAPPRTS